MPQPPQLCLALGGDPQGQQHPVAHRPGHFVASAMSLSPIFITKERCQLQTARDEKQMWKTSEYMPMKSDEEKKVAVFPSNITVTFLHFCLSPKFDC